MLNLTLKVIENLAKKVIADDTHIDVGLHGTKTILNALSENGYADLAYQVALQETYPSWGWWIVNGATTLYERWPLNPGRGTLNHIMMGEIMAKFCSGKAHILDFRGSGLGQFGSENHCRMEKETLRKRYSNDRMGESCTCGVL